MWEKMTRSTETRGGRLKGARWPSVVRCPALLPATGQELGQGREFTVDVSAEGIVATGHLVRRIVTGPYSPATNGTPGNSRAVS